MAKRKQRISDHSRGYAYQVNAGVQEIELLTRAEFVDDWRTTPAERSALRRMTRKGFLDRVNAHLYRLTVDGKLQRMQMYNTGHIPDISDEEKAWMKYLDLNVEAKAPEVDCAPANDDFDDDDPFGLLDNE